MSDARFDVLFAGKLMPGFTAETVRGNLARLFKASPDTVDRLLDGGTHVVKKNVDRDTALKYQEGMLRAGVQVQLRLCVVDQNSTSARAASTAAAGRTAWDLAPPGVELLAAHERQVPAPREIDTRHIKLASVFAATRDDGRAAPPPAPDTSHLSLAAAGTDLLAGQAPEEIPPAPDTQHLSLAAPGTPSTPAHTPPPVVPPDISGLTLAPAGAPLDEIRPTRKPVNPDISGLQLEP
jgi:hypothetical protein